MSDLERLASDLMAEGLATVVGVRAVVAKGALNVKKDWRQRASGLDHAPRYPFAIGYDVEVLPGLVQAVIGPDKDKTQGALGNLIEFGSAHNPPHNDGGQALQAEDPKFVAAMEALAGRKLR
jgi:hypothetical protein